MSGPSPEDPRLRGLFQALPRRRAVGEECPEPAELWASARGEVDPERNRWLIGHTGRCASCAEDWRLARHLERSGAVTLSTGAAEGSSASTSDRLRRFALAASVILAVAVAALWVAQTEWQPPVDRSDDRAKIESLTPEDRPLSREEPILRWQPPEGVEGARYEVIVSDPAGVPIHQTDRLSETEYRLPPELIDPLAPGTTLLWRVEGTLPDGSPISSTASRVTLE